MRLTFEPSLSYFLSFLSRERHGFPFQIRALLPTRTCISAARSSCLASSWPSLPCFPPLPRTHTRQNSSGKGCEEHGGSFFFVRLSQTELGIHPTSSCLSIDRLRVQNPDTANPFGTLDCLNPSWAGKPQLGLLALLLSVTLERNAIGQPWLHAPLDKSPLDPTFWSPLQDGHLKK